METRLSGHAAYRTEYRIVWITKYRRRILNPGVRGHISKLFPKIMKEMPGCEIIEQNIQEEFAHILMVIPPKYTVNDVVGGIKQNAASKIRKSLRGWERYIGKRMWYGHQAILYRQLDWMGNRLVSM